MPAHRTAPKHRTSSDSIGSSSLRSATGRSVPLSTKAPHDITRAAHVEEQLRDNNPQPPGSGAGAGSRGQRTPLALSDLECIRTLGAGTFGSVLAVRARHRPSAQFAVKAVNKRRIRENETALANWSPDIARHRRSEERMILAWLPWNPFFNGLIDVFADERNLYYVLELAPAGSLDSYLLTNGPVSAAAAQFYFANIVLGLEFLHSHDIAHRDLKPGNVLMGGDGYLSLCDFGGAAHIDSGPESWAVDAGTHEYQMPELLREESLPRDKRTAVDWWAAAVCLYKMFSQEVPFWGTDEGILAMATSGRIMWTERVTWPPALQDLLTGMWGAERFGSRTHKAASDEIPLNYELRSHEWTRDLKWSKIAQRREVAPFVPAPYPDMHEGSYDMPQQWTIPGLKRAPNQHHRCIDKDC